MSLVKLVLATNAQLRLGEEVLSKQVRQAWNVLKVIKFGEDVYNNILIQYL